MTQTDFDPDPVRYGPIKYLKSREIALTSEIEALKDQISAADPKLKTWQALQNTINRKYSKLAEVKKLQNLFSKVV